jgi:[acyl-carrier-protein] S-malonyltransferase
MSAVGVRREKPAQDQETAAPERGRLGLALLFPGQGSQRPGMAARLLQISRAARDVFEEADRALDFSLSRLCVDADSEELSDTENTQPALLATSIAYFEHLKESLRELGRRQRPALLAGHSLGQFSAAVASESLTLGDGLRLVKERGRIMKEWASRRPGGLASILGLEEAEVARLCDESSVEGDQVAVAAHNAPRQFIISGDDGALQRAMKLARGRGASVLRLPISVPGHTPAMEEAARQLRQVIDAIPFRDPATPLVSNITGSLLTTAEEVRQELADQICAAVEWVRCMSTMLGQGVSTFVEVGPGRALSNIARRFSENLSFLTVEDARPDDLASLGAPIESPQHA